jgi:drug/metabolite transporter (DMT)-like permease
VTTHPPAPVPPVLTLLIALVAMSTSGPVIRLAATEPLAVATWRLVMTLVVVVVAVTLTRGWGQLRRLSAGDVALGSLAGVFLALHFWTWMTSLDLTTVAASTVLVSLQPVFVAVGSAVLLAEVPVKGQWVGIGVAVVGAVIIGLGAGSEPGASHALKGDLLALAGAVAGAAYILAGRRLRRTLDIWPCVALMYSATLVVLLVFVVWQEVPLWPQPARAWWAFVALAIGPMLLGHTLLSYALRYLPAHVVNLTAIGEPVGAGLLAWLLLAEVPGRATLAGGAIAVAGLGVAARATARASAAATRASLAATQAAVAATHAASAEPAKPTPNGGSD